MLAPPSAAAAAGLGALGGPGAAPQGSSRRAARNRLRAQTQQVPPGGAVGLSNFAAAAPPRAIVPLSAVAEAPPPGAAAMAPAVAEAEAFARQVMRTARPRCARGEARPGSADAMRAVAMAAGGLHGARHRSLAALPRGGLRPVTLARVPCVAGLCASIATS